MSNSNPNALSSPKKKETSTNPVSVSPPLRNSPSKRMTITEINQKETELEGYKNDNILKTSEIQNLKVKLL